MRSIVLAANRGFALSNSRGELIRSLLEDEWRVVLATARDEHSEKLEKEGCRLVDIRFERTGIAPLSDARAFGVLLRVCRRERPLFMHNFNAKPVILGSIAGRRVLGKNVKIFNTITGLGHAFVTGAMIRAIAGIGYKLALNGNGISIFQNPDDLALFVRKGWVRRQDARMILGAGVDSKRFVPSDKNEKVNNSQLKVVMVARLIRQKGVAEFVKAAGYLRKRFPDVRFLLAGEEDHVHPDAVTHAELDEWVSRGVVQFLGYVKEMEKLLQRADIFVLPSYYREGLPRVILEAASCGIPCVGVDAPGTREVIRDGQTGFLVPPRDAQSLSEKIGLLLQNADVRKAMGVRGREMVEKEFDVLAVTRRYLDLYKEAGLPVRV